MALQSSGAISISQINAEVTAVDSNSLTTLSTTVGFSAPHAMSEFYGYSGVVNYTVNINPYVPGYVGCGNYYTFGVTSDYPVSTNVLVSIYWYGDLGGYFQTDINLLSGLSCRSANSYTGSSVNCIGEYLSLLYWSVSPTSNAGQNYFTGSTYYTDTSSGC